MGSYKLLIKPSAVKELESLPARDRRRLVARIRRLGKEPRPAGCEKLSGRNAFRIRQGAYRAVYTIDDVGREAVIVIIGHRREIYR